MSLRRIKYALIQIILLPIITMEAVEVLIMVVALPLITIQAVILMEMVEQIILAQMGQEFKHLQVVLQ